MRPREVAGKVARYLLHHAGLTMEQAGAITSNLSYPTIKRIAAGAPSVTDVKLQAMAGVLGLPISFFLLIIDEDYDRLNKLALPAHVREYLVYVLPSAVTPTRPPGSEREALVKD